MPILSNGEYLFCWPLAEHILTAGWYYSGGSLHRAIDLRTNTGGNSNKSVKCAFDGTVTAVHYWDGKSKKGTESYGNYIDVTHTSYNGMPLKTRYAHLSSIKVSKGQAVDEGQEIAISGSTGNVTGPHLHFEVWLNGTRVNPLCWLDDDFSLAYDYVYTYQSGEHSVIIPANEGKKLQRITIDKVSNEDAFVVMAVCEKLGLCDGRYTSQYI